MQTLEPKLRYGIPAGIFRWELQVNGMVLTEAEDIKKRWQECTKELYKNDLHDPDLFLLCWLCQSL